jgi:CheY-like chemotaxis protein
VVFSDIGLPGMDGYTFARRLREDEHLHQAHLVAVTGYGQGEDQRQAHAAGFDEHLTKPVAFADLERMLTALQSPSRAM